ncbi:MAG TPA: lipase, partial [Thalassospira sp.]|nr:lipase [Thalassospira sp.]
MNTFKTTVASAAFALAATLATTTALANPVLENNTQNFINALTASGGAPIYTLSPADARNVLAGAQAGPIAKRAADVTDTVFP